MSASASPSLVETAVTAPITFKQRGQRAKESFRKRPASSTIAPTRDNQDDSSSSSDEHDALEGPRIKRGKKGIISTSTNIKIKATPSEDHGPTAFQANRDIPLSDTNDATKRKDWYDQPTAKGPARAASNVRMTTTTDFARDLCKDYAKTGWCGFGDSCVFVHDRSDTPQGRQLDREWEVYNKKKKLPSNANKGENNGNADDDTTLDNIPLSCPICEGLYKRPIVTQCGHYFCEACALQRYRKDPSCRSCGAATMGVFNAASRLERLMRRKRERGEEATDRS
ncbi:Pre-mRNA-splicing factor CWC24 [Fusarium sp. LHS14.1]|nr:Pre-mRNA-splicing factor CWC24 [Fusarium sp. LHS14.1]